MRTSPVEKRVPWGRLAVKSKVAEAPTVLGEGVTVTSWKDTAVASTIGIIRERGGDRVLGQMERRERRKRRKGIAENDLCLFRARIFLN